MVEKNHWRSGKLEAGIGCAMRTGCHAGKLDFFKLQWPFEALQVKNLLCPKDIFPSADRTTMN